MNMKSGLRVAAPLALALALAACSSPKTYTFTLQSVPPRSAPSGKPLRPPIEMGEVGIPATIDRNSIVLTAPDDQLDVLQNSVWGAPMRQLIRNALSDDLNQRLPQGSVLPLGTPAPAGGLRIITVQVQQFEGSTDGRVVLDVGWTIARSGTTPKGEPHLEHITTRAANGTAAAIVPAMSAALGQLADRIVDRID